MGFTARVQTILEFTKRDMVEADWQKLLELMSVNTMQKIIDGEIDESETFKEIGQIIQKMEKPDTFESAVAKRKEWISKCREKKLDINKDIFHAPVPNNIRNLFPMNTSANGMNNISNM